MECVCTNEHKAERRPRTCSGLLSRAVEAGLESQMLLDGTLLYIRARIKDTSFSDPAFYWPKLIPEIVQLTLGWGPPTPQRNRCYPVITPLQVLVKGCPSIHFWPICGGSYSRVGESHSKLLRRKLLVLRRSHQSWKFLYQHNPGFSHNTRLPTLTPYD